MNEASLQKQNKKLKRRLRDSLAYKVEDDTLKVYLPKQMMKSKKIVKAEIHSTDARWF